MRRYSSTGGVPFRGLRRPLLLAAAAAASLQLVSPTAAPAATRPRTSVVAEARVRSLPVYGYPGAKRPIARFGRRTPSGEPRTFLVAQRLRGWERVYLPMRPNGRTGWVRDRQVSLKVNPYRVVVSRRHHTVSVYRYGRRIMRTKAGVGRSVMPTPAGTYFIVELLKQPNPRGAYGPYAFGLSAFSNVLYHFGAGPGQIGLHGTDYPAGLGTSVSHGCIRVSNAAISRLAHMLPLGTPVEIRRS